MGLGPGRVFRDVSARGNPLSSRLDRYYHRIWSASPGARWASQARHGLPVERWPARHAPPEHRQALRRRNSRTRTGSPLRASLGYPRPVNGPLSPPPRMAGPVSPPRAQCGENREARCRPTRLAFRACGCWGRIGNCIKERPKLQDEHVKGGQGAPDPRQDSRPFKGGDDHHGETTGALYGTPRSTRLSESGSSQPSKARRTTWRSWMLVAAVSAAAATKGHPEENRSLVRSSHRWSGGRPSGVRTPRSSASS
jgi:hypothetical protein